MIFGLLLALVFLAFVVFKYRLGKQMHRHYQPTEEELLSAMALERECSVYAIFMDAGKQWAYSEEKIDNDFDHYLQTTDIPLYVRQLLRNQPPSKQAVKQSNPPLPLGPI